MTSQQAYRYINPGSRRENRSGQGRLQYIDIGKKKILKERLQVSSAGFLQHSRDEIDELHLVNPTCFVLRVDVGESRRYQCGAQISSGYFFFEPEALSGWDYCVAGAVKYENWNFKIRNLAMGRERGEFRLIGVEGGE